MGWHYICRWRRTEADGDVIISIGGSWCSVQKRNSLSRVVSSPKEHVFYTFRIWIMPAGPAHAAAYNVPGHIAEAVVNDIAQWIERFQ